MALGLLVGKHYFGRANRVLGTFGEAFLLERYADLQCAAASYPKAQKALRTYLAYLDSQEMKAGDTEASDEQLVYPSWLVKVQKLWAWSRLALLHERNNKPVAAEEAWRNAESFAAACGWNETNRARLRDFITRRESRCFSSRPTQSK